MVTTYYPKDYPELGMPGPRPLGVSYVRPYSVQAITPYGEPEYQEALEDWRRGYGEYAPMAEEVAPALRETLEYYRPGGGYGAGRRTEAEEAVRGGVAGDIGQMVATGMSSQFGARGVGTRAGAELSKLYKNIEDMRAQLQMQAFQPYAQIMQAISQMMQTRPAYGEYVKPVTTTRQAQAWF